MSDKTTGIDNALKVLDGEQIKTAVLVLPVAGTLAAVTFDVGYFSGVDVNYFPIFSLSEHIGFALLVSPLAFSLTFVAWILLLILDKGIGMSMYNNIYLKKMVLVGGQFAAVSLFFLHWWFFGWTLDLFMVITAIFFAVAILIGLGCLILLPYVALLLYGGDYFLGYDLGHRYVTGTVATHLLNDDTAGRLIRAGERGVLFVTMPDKKIELFKWDGIKSIRTIKLTDDDREKLRYELRHREEQQDR